MGAATNKPLSQFPTDLMHRVLLQVNFDGDEEDQRLVRSCRGFDREQCVAFWARNAVCLMETSRLYLAARSVGCNPRELQLWVQKVLIDVAAHAMNSPDGPTEAQTSPARLKPPNLANFLKREPVFTDSEIPVQTEPLTKSPRPMFDDLTI